jgi:hypothetical protein
MFLIYGLKPADSIEYVGLTHSDRYDRRMREHGRDNTVKTPDFESVILFDNIPSRAEAREMEKVFINAHNTFENGYNKTRGGSNGTECSDETKQKISEKAREDSLRRVKNGTHNFLGGKIQRESNLQRVKDDTHNFLDGKIQRETQHQRVKNGMHNFVGESNPNHKRLEDGMHNFVGESNPNHKRLEDGTHHLLGERNPIKRLAKEGRHPRTLKRLKGEWCYIIALSRFYYEIHDYTLKRRAEFLSKDIPDTSKAEQVTFVPVFVA